MPAGECRRSTILVVEDDDALAEMLRDYFTPLGYLVCLAASGAAAEALVETIEPDVILIDLILPDQHGLLLCANLKQTLSAPIIICSGTRRKDDAALAFKLGAADFVHKPVSLDELEIRIERALRAPADPPSANPQVAKIMGGLAVDAARHVVTVDGREIPTTPTEYRLLTVLLDRADHVVSVADLGKAVWGKYDSSLDASLKVHIRRLRAKLKAVEGRAPEVVVVRGFGYRLLDRTMPQFDDAKDLSN
jgi:DNA-binding response OmpR family regulator